MKSILFSLFIIFLIWVYLFVTTGRIPSFKIPYINPKKTKSSKSVVRAKEGVFFMGESENKYGTSGRGKTTKPESSILPISSSESSTSSDSSSSSSSSGAD